jgi:hypothetical protein
MLAREYISASAFDPEERDLILGALEAAWAEIEHHFYDCPLSVEPARAWLADEILAAVQQKSRSQDELKNLALQAMAMRYRLGRGASERTGGRAHNARYWRAYTDETLAKADQTTDPECKRLLLGIAETYAQLARHAAAAEARSQPKLQLKRNFGR